MLGTHTTPAIPACRRCLAIWERLEMGEKKSSQVNKMVSQSINCIYFVQWCAIKSKTCTILFTTYN